LRPEGAVAVAVEAPAGLAYLRDLFALTKPRITAMNVVTAAGGLLLAPGDLPWTAYPFTLAAMALVVGGAGALNCYYERDVDARMHRTRERPLAAGRVAPRAALVLGLGMGALSVPLFLLGANALAAGLAIAAYVGYVWIYTPLKRRTSDALVVGAVPGAMPPLIGWAAATGRIELPGLVLFALLFVWQLPHFLAIALYLREDYARGGIKVLPLERGVEATKRLATIFAAAQLLVSLLLPVLGLAGWFYAAVAATAGLAFFAFAARGHLLAEAATRRWARALMLGSVAYLGVVFLALAVDAW
jgi:protoheme IX farnesyltransferase